MGVGGVVVWQNNFVINIPHSDRYLGNQAECVQRTSCTPSCKVSVIVVRYSPTRKCGDKWYETPLDGSAIVICTRHFCQILMKLEMFSTDFRKKKLRSQFLKNSSSGSRDVTWAQTDGQTDMTKLIVVLAILETRLKRTC